MDELGLVALDLQQHTKCDTLAWKEMSYHLGNLPGNGHQVPYLMSVLAKDDGSDL